MRDSERINRVQDVLREQSLDALVCALPHNVLLLTGYWPVTGLSVAVATRDGRTIILAPEDEKHLAEEGWAEIQTFTPASLTSLKSSREIVEEKLAELGRDLGLDRGKSVGYENSETFIPVPYSAVHFFGPMIVDILRAAFPLSNVRGASEFLEHLRSVLTRSELEKVRLACGIAQEAFLHAATQIQPGLREPEVASAFRAWLEDKARGAGERLRTGGWTWCMSGPNAAKASAAYARTRSRAVEKGDLVMIHSNSYADGFWTDITRTFSLEPSSQVKEIYKAVFEAFTAAVNVVKPGAQASAVDKAARDVLTFHGFGKQFKHATGHGVGFAAIDHNAKPRLHPLSPDVLESGMLFNIEPAVYIDGFGGIRQCSMVAVTEHGAEVLTPFQAELQALTIRPSTDKYSDAVR